MFADSVISSREETKDINNKYDFPQIYTYSYHAIIQQNKTYVNIHTHNRTHWSELTPFFNSRKLARFSFSVCLPFLSSLSSSLSLPFPFRLSRPSIASRSRHVLLLLPTTAADSFNRGSFSALCSSFFLFWQECLALSRRSRSKQSWQTRELSSPNTRDTCSICRR